MALLVDLIVPPGLQETVTLIVDASSAPVPVNVEEDPTPELQVEILKSGEKVEDADVKLNCKDEVLKKYSVEFTPPSPAEYTVSLKYGESEVEGSPLTLNLSHPRSKDVLLTQPPTGKIRAGQSIDIVFDTFPGGRGELKATCNGEVTGEIPVLVSRKGITMEHKVTFLPPHEDVYSLQVSFGKHSVKGSPFKIDLIPVNPKKVVCSKPVVPKDGPIEMDVCTEGAGNAALKANCTGKACGVVSVDIDKLSKNNYHLKFEPPEKDVFTLSVLYGGKSVKNSPFVIDIASHPDKVRLGELHVPDCAGIEGDVWVEADCSEAGTNELKANCEGQNEEGSIPVSIEDCGEDKYRVKFTPRIPDIYTLTLFLGSDVIPGGTYDINLLPKSNSKMVKHIGTFIPDDPKEPIVFSFDASKGGEGEMRARVNGISLAGPVASKVELVDPETKEYRVTFISEGADTYDVDVYWSDETIPGSPIYVKIVDATQVLLSGPVDPELTCPITVDVDTKLAGPGVLSVACLGEKTGDIETEIIRDDSDNTQYTVSFRPVEADRYTLRVYLDDIEVKPSPVEVDLRAPEPVVELCDACAMESSYIEQDLLSPIEADADEEESTPTWLEMNVGDIMTMNIGSLEGDDTLTVTAVGESLGEVPVSITPEEDGAYTIIFDPTEPDTYTIDVKHGEEPVPGSPFIATYRERLVPRAQTPPEDIPTHPITKPYLIRYVPEAGVDNIVAYATHDDSCTRHVLTIRKKDGVKTLLAFKAEKVGVHIIHITRDGKEIQGAPFKLDIVLADPQACKVVSVPEVAYVGEEVNIVIDTSKAGTGDMHVIAAVPLGGGETVFSHKENQDGDFVIKFKPLVAGKHSLSVKWAGVPIPDTPISVVAHELTEEVVQARDAASRVSVHAPKGTFGTRLKHSEAAHLFIATEKAGQGGEITVKAKGPSNAKIDVVRLKTALYKCSVKPVVSGKYQLEILWNGFPISRQPYQFDFTAEKTYIINDLDLESEKFVIGTPSEYVVDCSYEEEGELKILADPSDCAQVDVSPVEGRDEVFKVRVVPKQQGNHEISIKFAGEHILRSPYHVQFETADKPEQDSESQDNTRLQRLSGLDFPLSLPADAAPEAVGAVPSVPAGDSSYQTTVTAFGPGLEGGVIGQEGNFTIKTSKAGDGKLEIAIHGARGTFQTKLRRHPDSERTLLARYDPTNIGQYTIDILWLDEHIEGSPFEVDVKAQETE